MNLSSSEKWRYALSAFKLNRRMAMTNAMAVAIAVVYVIVPCYSGQSLYTRQRRILGESSLNLIVATVPARHSTGGFTRAAIDQLRQRPEVALAFPKMEQNLKVWPGRLATPDPWIATVEATIPDDPGIRPELLCWGQPPATTRDLAVVISRSLLRRLGGELGEAGPTIEELTLGATRTRAGQPEQLTVTLRIAGILDQESATNTVFVPLDVMERMDQWCLQHIPSFGVHVGHVPVGEQAEALNRELIGNLGPVVATMNDGSNIELHAAMGFVKARYPAVRNSVEAPRTTAQACEWTVVVSPEAAECFQLAVGAQLPFTLTSTRGETREFAARVARIERSSVDFRLPEAIHDGLARWWNGWATFEPSTRSFVSLSAFHARQGHPRCNIYAKGLEEVRTLVDWLEANGHRTDNQLAAQDGLKAMGRAITVLVCLLSFGCLVIANATVLLSSSMSAQARAHEIGVLQALGLHRRTICSIFARQGLLVGVFAFAAASASVFFGEPALRRFCSEVVTLPFDELFEGQIYSIQFLWIHALALAVAVLSCMVGATLPVRRLAKRQVTELLRLNA